jgi:FlaA1/EpsC-like NDP-sugar epimerase
VQLNGSFNSLETTNFALMPTWAEIWVVRLLSRKHLPTWLVLLIDFFLVICAYFGAQLLLTNFDLDKFVSYNSVQEISIVLFCFGGCFFWFKTYIGAFRHTGVRDLLRLGYSSISAAILITVFSFAADYFNWFDTKTLTLNLVILQSVTFLLSVTGVRLFVKLVYSRYILNPTNKKNRGILVFGAGATGVTVRNAIKQDRNSNRDVIAFIDDNPKLQGKSIDGIKVVSIDYAFNPDFIEQHKIKEVVWSVQNTAGDSFFNVGELCIKNNLEFHKVPNIKDWIGGNLSRKQIKRVRIEDLLNRTVISLENRNLSNFISNKTILVTGAAGSIGSEICRQILFYGPKNLILFDNAETPMHDLYLELRSSVSFSNNVVCIIGDVTRANRVEEAFSTFKPQIVFHAAAYKHVPMMEVNAKEAVKVNIKGTKLVSETAIAHGASKFVLISTDKAVNPTNVMGATKRAAEIFVQNISNKGNTEFITTRFGNVLGSNGSVIPLFRKQIENRQPLTVTHRDVIRYFMTIPEACQLVFEAATMGKGGEIFVFDMGDPVRIYDLAEKMIRLSGLVLGQDISIVETGLRPGEKLYEELLSNHETTLPTHHPKIMIAKVSNGTGDAGKEVFESLSYGALNGVSDVELVGILKSLIPEYKSENSDFAILDN